MNKAHELNYEFESDTTAPCRMAEGWTDAGKTGQYFGWITVNDRKWIIVLWDDDDEPEFVKDGCIEISRPTWKKP